MDPRKRSNGKPEVSEETGRKRGMVLFFSMNFVTCFLYHDVNNINMMYQYFRGCIICFEYHDGCFGDIWNMCFFLH